MDDNGPGLRLQFARQKWHLTPEALSDRSGVDVVTIRQVEAGDIDPDESTIQRLGDALCIYAQWLEDADIPMVPLWCMSKAEQHKQQSGPGTENLPGYVIVGPGPWFTDDDGEWQVDPAFRYAALQDPS